jgi:hypothetical protein
MGTRRIRQSGIVRVDREQIRELAREIVRGMAREQYAKDHGEPIDENSSDLREIQLGPAKGSQH